MVVMQSNVVARTPSPVKVVITRVGSQGAGTNSSRPGSGRTRSPENFSETDNHSDVRRSSLRPLSVEDNVSTLLQVPGSNGSVDHGRKEETRKARKDDNSSMTYHTRNRSSSPFNKRDGLPCGSPTFQKVLYEILAEAEVSAENADDGKQHSVTVPTTKDSGQSKSRQSRRRSSVSPAAQFRRRSIYS